MTTAQAMAILTAEEAVAKLLQNGYTSESCADCKGVGHHTITPNDGTDWKRFMCTRCDGHGRVWKAPLTR